LTKLTSEIGSISPLRRFTVNARFPAVHAAFAIRRLSVAFRTFRPMAYDFQLTVDCADPHPLADWWADLLGWDVEPSNEEFIRRMVAEGKATEDDTATYRGRLVWKIGAAITHPDQPKRRILFQHVPEPKTVKNRLHLDVRMDDEETADKELARLTAKGATLLYRGQQGPFNWVTIADPEGNEICLSR
jgi:Glyoxalase-like domain